MCVCACLCVKTFKILLYFDFLQIFVRRRFAKIEIYSRVSNRRGGWNKREGWQISAKIINEEVCKSPKVNQQGGRNKRGG